MMMATVEAILGKEVAIIDKSHSDFQEDLLGGFPLYLAKFSLTIGLNI